jgi:putative polymerase
MTTIATARGRNPNLSWADLNDSISPWMPLALILAAMSFQMALCWANTNVTAVGNLHVIVAEAIVITVAFAVSYRLVSHTHVFLLGGLALYALALGSIRFVFGMDDSLDIKVVRDLIIPVVFFLLGMRGNDAKNADFVVRVSVSIVLIFALFEYFWVDEFTRFFNVAQYYMARGSMEARQALQSGELFVSGVRPAGIEGGRNLLPFLGDHRVSSVFLEPISAGNFGMIVVLWALVRSKFENKIYFGLLLAGLSVIVLADSRFGAIFCALCLVAVMLPQSYVTIGIATVAPLALICLIVLPGLVTGSYDPQHRYVDNGFVGRMVLASQILDELDVWGWLGLKPTRQPAFDSGYAYVISGIGVIGAAVLWYVVLSIRGSSRQFQMLRNLGVLYYGVILCISNSPFTIKTAALLWFLLGTLWHQGQPRLVPATDRFGRLSATSSHGPRIVPARRPGSDARNEGTT